MAELTELLHFTPAFDQLEIISHIPAIRDIIEKHNKLRPEPLEPITRADLGVSAETWKAANELLARRKKCQETLGSVYKKMNQEYREACASKRAQLEEDVPVEDDHIERICSVVGFGEKSMSAGERAKLAIKLHDLNSEEEKKSARDDYIARARAERFHSFSLSNVEGSPL